MHRLAPIALVALAGCITEEEFNTLKAERDALRGRVAKLEDELDVARARNKELQVQLEKSAVERPSRPADTREGRAQVASAYSQLEIAKGDDLIAVLHTSKGDIDCQLFPSVAPATVLNFVGLAEGTKEYTDPTSGDPAMGRYYDGTKFHRVIDGFMIQGGDPLGTGRGGPGFTIPDEIWPDVRFDRPGVLAMANAGPNTGGSQFFVTSRAVDHLNGKHSIFGLCETEVVQKIMEVEVGGVDATTPLKDVILKSVEIQRKRQDAED